PAELTEAGVLMGTVAYMSPEQAKGKPLDARTDLYSFGAVLYEMATGVLPFRGESTGEILAAIFTEIPAPVSQLNELAPQELDRIIGKGVEKDPSLRYQSASEMRTDLQRLRRDATQPRLTTAGRRAAVVPPNMTRWLGAGAAGVAVAAALWFGRGALHPAAPT